MAKPKMTPIRASAKGEDCTLNIAGVCNYDSATVVLCHFPSDWSGKGIKSPDYVAGYGCSACHDAFDRRVKLPYTNAFITKEEQEEYARRSTYRTHEKLIAKGLMTMKGVSK